MSDTLATSAFVETASAVAEPLSAPATTVPVEPEQPPEPAPRPVTQRERIPTIDVIRGVALMGILLMNIAAFSGPFDMYVNPLAVPGHRSYNIFAWAIRWVLFEGKMRAAFSMLFGAGVILLTERAERRGSRNVADIFLRRNMWLVLFGVLHFYFVWWGDILYYYGLTALLFLYPCRKLRFRNLFIAGALVLAIGVGSDVYFGLSAIRTRKQGEAAQTLQAAGKKLTQAQQDALKNWTDVLEHRKKTNEADLKANRGSYLDLLKWHAELGPRVQATSYYEFGFTDVLGMMILGMGLYRMGFLTGALSFRAYAWTIGVGFLLSIPINGVETWGMIRDNFQPETVWWVLYQLGRLTGAVANVAVIVIISKAGLMPSVTRRIAAVGQTALSNYLFTSITCTAFFWGFKLYGRFEYYQLYAVVAAVWLLNLTLSPIWLRYFQFGPMEWVWRSLTYWKRQPMRRSALEEQEALAA
ncbi:MAG TPA: DUF418 domain-containing protein [Terracidiphilus sp.]